MKGSTLSSIADVNENEDEEAQKQNVTELQDASAAPPATSASAVAWNNTEEEKTEEN